MSEKVKLYVSNTVTYIADRLPSDVYQGLRKLLGYRPETAIFKIKYGNKNWDGIESTLHFNERSCKCSIKKKGTHFPTGLFNKARDFLVSNGIELEIFDIRDAVSKNIELEMSADFEFRDYQTEVIKKSVEMQRGLIKCPTGSGKTAIAAGIIQEIGVSPFVFYVPSIDLLQQTQQEFGKFLRYNGSPLGVGIIGNGKFDIKDINVMTVQTAVRSLGGKYIRFDDEDKEKVSKEELKVIEQKKNDILLLIQSAKGFMADECITGDALVFVKNFGHVKMRELNKFIGEEILSFNGASAVWNKITHFVNKGKKKLIKIRLCSGKSIKCTKNHLIKTKRGWVQAGNLETKDKILSFVNADVEQKSMCDQKALVDIQNMYWAIKSKNVVDQNGMKNLNKWLPRRLYVNADVEKKLIYDITPWIFLLRTKGDLLIENTFMVMTRKIFYMTLNYHSLSFKQFVVLFWEILLLLFLLLGVKTQDFVGIMDYVKRNGQSTKQIFLKIYFQNIMKQKIKGSERCLFVLELLASQIFLEHARSHMLSVRKELQQNGLIISDILDSLYGSEMTGRHMAQELDFILKDFLLKRLNCVLNGSLINMEKPLFKKQEGIISYICQKKPLKEYAPLSKNISHHLCSIKYMEIESIENINEDTVYDISVEKTHCFFANGMLVHNCQHWASETAQIIADNSISARYRWGLSATPWRDKGDDILIDACFGRQICNITASYLIEHPNKYLIRPDIYLLPFDLGMPKEDLFSYHEYYKTGIVENLQRNQYIAKIAKNFEEQGRLVLILCQHVSHGKILEKLIDGSVFLHGEHSSKQRKDHLQKMREGRAGVTVATSIFDEGIDCKPLDTLILAGGGKSQTRALQRVGRVLRPYTSPSGRVKDSATVVDIQDSCKYLSAHGKKRKKIYQTEPAFNIKDIKV